MSTYRFVCCFPLNCKRFQTRFLNCLRFVPFHRGHNLRSDAHLCHNMISLPQVVFTWHHRRHILSEDCFVCRATVPES